MTNISITTHLRLTEGKFVPLEQFFGDLADHVYVEGAVRMILDGTELFGFEQWTEMVELWYHLIISAESVRRDGRAWFHFPDSSVLLAMVLAGDDLEILCRVGAGDRKVRVAASAYVTALTAAGESFFRRLLTLIPEDADFYREMLQKLVALGASFSR